MEIEKSIEATRREFEKSFQQAVLYNSQTQNQAHLDMILNLIPIKKKDMIIDLSTGSGYLSFALAQKYQDVIHKFKEMKRVLRPEGRIFISDPTPNEDDTEGFADDFM